jgi:hypothetical protein
MFVVAVVVAVVVGLVKFAADCLQLIQPRRPRSCNRWQSPAPTAKEFADD